MRIWLERIRDYFTRRAFKRAREHWEPLETTTKARCDLYEHAFLEQQRIINRLKERQCSCSDSFSGLSLDTSAPPNKTRLNSTLMTR